MLYCQEKLNLCKVNSFLCSWKKLLPKNMWHFWFVINSVVKRFGQLNYQLHVTLEETLTYCLLLSRHNWTKTSTMGRFMWKHQRMLSTDLAQLLNPLQPFVAFLYPLRTSETFRFSNVFGGYRKATPGCNGLTSRLDFPTKFGFANLKSGLFII